jgi:hypothetical protein
MTPLAVKILFAASRCAAGVRVRELVDAVVRRDGRSLGAARVAVSQQARSLWRAGYAELRGPQGTMTERVIAQHEVAARAFRDPERFYDFAVKLRGEDPYGSALECARARARAAQKMPRHHIRHITITSAGLARLDVVLGGKPNSSAGEKLSDPVSLNS